MEEIAIEFLKNEFGLKEEGIGKIIIGRKE